MDDNDAAQGVDEHAGHSHEHDMPTDEEIAQLYENFAKAGKIAASVLREAPKLVLPGESYFDIAESLEKMILDAGGNVGFPANISINEIAAHFTPEAESSALIGETDLVKIDIGAQIDGCIGDTAVTIDLSGEYGKLCEASQAALDAAVSIIRPGISGGDIGTAIEKEIASRGYKPIENLTGHKIEPYLLHAGVDVPNVGGRGGYEMQEGDIFAIEPFSSTGSGHVADTSQVEIFSLQATPRLRMKYSRELLEHVMRNYFSLPFAERWLRGVFNSRLTLSTALRDLINSGALHPYPVLRDTGKGMVSQFEHTVIVEHDSARVTTKA